VDAIDGEERLLDDSSKRMNPSLLQGFALRFDSLKKPVTGFEPATY
jgi:hypothetical protein